MPPILFLCDSLFSRRPNPLKLLPFFPNIELLTSFSLALLDNRLVSFCKCFVNIIFNNSSGKPIFTKCLGAYLTVYFCLGRSTRSEEQFLKTAFVGGREKREKAKERVTKQVTERERERDGGMRECYKLSWYRLLKALYVFRSFSFYFSSFFFCCEPTGTNSYDYRHS